MQFTRAYSSACVCAPSRACLLTGKSLATSPIRDNGELPKMDGRFAGQRAMPEGTPTLATKLQQAGYATDPAYAEKLAKTIQTTQRVQSTLA